MQSRRFLDVVCWLLRRGTAPGTLCIKIVVSEHMKVDKNSRNSLFNVCEGWECWHVLIHIVSDKLEKKKKSSCFINLPLLLLKVFGMRKTRNLLQMVVAATNGTGSSCLGTGDHPMHSPLHVRVPEIWAKTLISPLYYFLLKYDNWQNTMLGFLLPHWAHFIP
jgi:hypothetical protein